MKESFENLIDIWGNCEKILYLISNKSGELPRKGIKNFAKPISGEIEKILESGSVELNTEEDLINLVKKAQKYSDVDEINRCFGINFSNIGDEKNTIEFRLPNGTVDATVWIQNINLFGGIMKACEELALIQTKQGELSEEEKKLIQNFEKLKHSKDENEKLECLLKLTIPEKNRGIYQDRYITNKKLLKENLQIEAILSSKVAKRSCGYKKI